MPLHVHLSQPFEHEHETRMFEALAANLSSHYQNGESAHLLGNILCDGREFDGLFLQQTGICVVELKSYSGQIHFSENGPWWANEVQVMGGNQPNPFRQVRNNKYGLLNFLSRRTYGVIPEQNWGHISGSVIFNPPVTFDARQLPGMIAPWFHITDLDNAPGILTELYSREINLTPEHLATLAGLFGSTPRTITAQPRPQALRLHYHKESGFRNALQDMRNKAGAAQIAANIFISFSEQLRTGRDPFQTLPVDERPEVPNLKVFTIGTGYFLAAVRNNQTLHLCTIGDMACIDSWINANTGLTFAIDANGKVTVSYVGNTRANLPSAVTFDQEPYLSKLTGLRIEDWNLPALIQRMLLEINEESTEEERNQILETITDPELRSCLADIFGMLRTGDPGAAQARLDLFNGIAIPEEDRVEDQAPGLDPETNSDTLIDLVGLSQEDWEKLLDPSKFQDWMLFLHPDQRRIVEEDHEKPAILKGVSGSGKTCVLVHRAKRLAQLYPDDRIGVLTLSRSLATLIKNLVKELCPGELQVRIEVFAFYDYFKTLVDHFGPEEELANLRDLMLKHDCRDDMLRVLSQVNPENYAREFDPVSRETLDDTWDLFLDQPDVGTLRTYFREHLFTYDNFVSSSKYLREEFSLIRSAAATATREKDYLELPRHGRSIPFKDKTKKLALDLLLLYEETMLSGGVLDELALTLNLLPHLSKFSALPDNLRFRCLLVDEYQDMSTRDLALLRRVVPIAEPNALFLTGDTVQRVMVKSFEPAKAALGIHDTIRRNILKNYRNSRQILLAAGELSKVYGKLAENLGEEIDYLDPELAVRETACPMAIKVDQGSQIKAAWDFARECLETTKRKAWSVCIVTACEETYPIKEILGQRPPQFPVHASRLTGDYTRKKDTMTVGSMADVKGFEFSMVIVVGCERRCLPNRGASTGEAWRDALRLYVAMTRARDEVRLLYSDNPSEFLNTMGEFLTWND